MKPDKIKSSRTWTFQPADDVRLAMEAELKADPQADRSQLINESLRRYLGDAMGAALIRQRIELTNRIAVIESNLANRIKNPNATCRRAGASLKVEICPPPKPASAGQGEPVADAVGEGAPASSFSALSGLASTRASAAARAALKGLGRKRGAVGSSETASLPAQSARKNRDPRR